MGRPGTSKAEATIMVQMRKSAESGGVQGKRCFSRIDKIDGGGWVGSWWWAGERSGYA